MTSAKGKIGVVGAGLMGAEIALVYALGGYEVLLHDRAEAELNSALDRLAGILDKGIARGFYKEAEKPAALARISATTDLTAFGDRDMVTEAVFEDEAVKGNIFRALDGICAPRTLIASNTSSIAIAALAAQLSPERRPFFLGTHYFSPVSRMRLVEVIPQFDTAEEAVERAMAYCRDAGKTPIPVKDVVGFAVNRVLHAFVIEAIKLVEEGVATPEDIDLACKLGLGHPIGPFELMDVTTSSLCLQVQEILHEAYGERFRPPALLKQRVQAGFLGRKAGRGWLKTAERKR
ncbi:MAG TPA: 3-hydroxyacyl-CoA dehydrogenase family protein [Stellaceae bacterium]|nr:3-hydroxyacyl-CoA dehydrogenase family protein [Stellaceae bacterium]